MNRPSFPIAAALTAALLGGAVTGAISQNNAGNAASPAAANGDPAAETTRAAIGKPAPDFLLTSPAGKTCRLSAEREGKKATVVIFIATQCPVSNDYNERMASLAKDYAARGVPFIGINSNRQESVEEVGNHAKTHKLPFPVLVDVGNVVADAYEARVTPHAYVIDGEGNLRYKGRIDDSQNASQVKSQDLRAAIDAVLTGGTVPQAETKAFGCGIKRMPKETEQ